MTSSVKRMFSILMPVCIAGCLFVEVPLDEDPLVTAHFDAEEIESLNRLLSFFDDEVRRVSWTNGSNAENYRAYLQRLKWEAELGNITSLIDGERLSEKLATLPEDHLNEIWQGEKTFEVSSGEVTILSLNPEGKYSRLLGSVSASDSTFMYYHEAYKRTEGISAAMITGLLYNHDHFNYYLQRKRLIVAVHFMSLTAV